METEQPGCILTRQFRHAVDDLLPLRPVDHTLHFHEHAIKLWVAVIGGVFAAPAGLGIGAVQQKEEIFWVGIVSIPAPLKKLRITLRHLVLEAVVISGTNDQLYIEFAELLDDPIQP